MKTVQQGENSLLYRRVRGIKIGIIAILINLLLFAVKLTVGFLFDSISLKADAINNLSDFASAMILLISFYISSLPADREHPFGHARFEYVASAIVAMIIMLLGLQLGRSSFDKVLNPLVLSVNWLFYGTLLFSIALKLFLYFYYIKQSKELSSPLVLATARDSISDVISSAGLLIAILVGNIFSYPLDGWAGLLISVLILYSGFSILRRTGNRLLGQKADRSLRNRIKDFILSKDGIYGVHDLIVHDYGVDNYYASAHVEVDAAKDVKVSHELIDQIEREIAVQFNINMVLHLDPIDLNNPKLEALEKAIGQVVAEVDEGLTVHDLRLIDGKNTEHLAFDIKVPDNCKLTNQELRQQIGGRLQGLYPGMQSFITIDRNYEIDTVNLPYDQFKN